MKTNIILKYAAIALIILGYRSAYAQKRSNSPDSATVYRQLKAEDSLFYNAIFHTGDARLAASMLANEFAFYQDQGYNNLTKSQSRVTYLAGINSLCDPKNKAQNPAMRREVVRGTLQAFISASNEAIQTGTQRFFMLNAGSPDHLVEESKFWRLWQQRNGHWQMVKEMDYLYNTHLNDAPPVKEDELTIEITHMDSVLFDAFNNQDLATTGKTFARDVEFYHDKGGLSLYQTTMDNFKSLFENNKTSGLRRELVPGSLHVYPIKGYGAIETGEHRFCHMENGQQDCGNFKFTVIWKQTGGSWQATRVISYGHVDALPASDSLYKTVYGLDKQLFDAFNTQNLDTMGKLFAPGLEFYQDNEGLVNYEQTMSDFRSMFEDNQNNGLHRDLVNGTLEIYPIPGYGAIETGKHRFCHQENGKQDCGTFEFMNVWQLKDGQWKLTRAISFGH